MKSSNLDSNYPRVPSFPFVILVCLGLVALPTANRCYAAVVEDVGFSDVPTRSVNSQTLNRSVDAQGGTSGNIRGNTALNGGSTGWFAEYNGANFDEDITTAAARTGTQSFRTANWYSSGIINAAASPWLAAPAGETGTKDNGGTSGANGVVANANQFHTSFWFTTVSNTDPTSYSWLSTALDDGTGARWGGAFGLQDSPDAYGGAFVPEEQGFRAMWASINQRDLGGGDFAASPPLVRGDWYRADILETFVPGNSADSSAAAGAPNDIVFVKLYDASNNLVWSVDSSTPYYGIYNQVMMPDGITNWEDAGFYGTSYAVNSMQIRMSVNSQNGGAEDNWNAQRPTGFYFDDWLIETLNDGVPVSQYYTSFELFAPAEVFIPEPSSLVLLGLGIAGLVGARRRRVKV